MPAVKFLRDFRGVNTNEVFYQAGEVVTLEDGQAAGVIAEGAAVRLDGHTSPPLSGPVDEPAGPTPGEATVTIAGRADSAPTVTITGPITDVVLTNETTGEVHKPTARKRASKKAAKP